MQLVCTRLCLLIGIVFVVICSASPAQAISSPSSLVLKRIQVGTAADATDELIEITNVSSQAVDIKGLIVEYKSATGVTWSKKVTVAESRKVAPNGVVIFANKQAHDISLTAGLAQVGGNLRIVLVGKTLDQVAWGTGDSPEGKAVASPPAGRILERRCNPTCQDTDNNEADFWIENDPASASVAEGTPMDETIASIEITELLPDPASPQTDARDEYIELHNAGTAPEKLAGWKLISGKQTYKLDDLQIAAGQYVVLTSATTKLGLANTGDTVSLIDSTGSVVAATPNYGVAKVGVAYGVTEDSWAWLDHPTPASANAGQLVDTAQTSKEKAPKAAAKKATTAKKSTASTKSTSAKSVASAVKDAANASSTSDDSKPVSSFSSAWVLALLGVFAVGYGVYEYRPELLSLIARRRAKSQAGREPVKNIKAGRRH